MKDFEKKKSVPKDFAERTVISGYHKSDIRDPKVVYNYWASDYLMEQFPCPGDVVRVRERRKFRDGTVKLTAGYIIVTDVQRWQEGMFEPKMIALNLVKNQEKYGENLIGANIDEEKTVEI